MAQNAVLAYLYEMAPMAKLKFAAFLIIIYVLHIGTIFTKVNNNNNDILLRTHGPYHRHKNTKRNIKKINVLKRKIFVFIFASNFQQMKYKLSIRTITYFYTHLFLL